MKVSYTKKFTVSLMDSNPNLFQPAIVVLAYNRPNCLNRLLLSLQKAVYPDRPVTLVISVDHSDISEVRSIAEKFEWKQGTKKLVLQETRLGLREHVLRSGDLSQQFGSIILLEDDLIVSPHFYSYTEQALKFYEKEEAIAGISLYSYRIHVYYWVNDFALQFTPIDDGFDNYFVRYGSSWGQAYNRHQWRGFRDWLEKQTSECMETPPRPPRSVRNWPETSWKKYFIKYLVESGKTFVFPRTALSTNGGDVGTHFGSPTLRLQVPLLVGEKTWNFSCPHKSTARYDAHFEIEAAGLKKLNPSLEPYSFECDLTGVKQSDEISSENLLTFRKMDDSLVEFGSDLNPIELNPIAGVPGNAIRLVPRSKWEAALKNTDGSEQTLRNQFDHYFNSKREIVVQVANQGMLQEVLALSDSRKERLAVLESENQHLKQSAQEDQERKKRLKRTVRGRIARWLTRKIK